MLDDQNNLHLIDKGMVKKSSCRRSRSFKRCIEDGGRGVCSSDMHHLDQKPVSAAQMQFILATRIPRARQVAGRAVCGSDVGIAVGISIRDSAATEKSFLQLVIEGLCGATATLVQRLDCRTPHSWYTFVSQLRSEQTDECFVLLSVVYHSL